MGMYFVMVSCVIDRVNDVMNEIEKIPEVTRVDRTFGIYDLIIIMETTPEEVCSIIKEKIRSNKNVKQTTTLVCI